MKTPNLFKLATSELSQDAFITWLLQWSDPQYKDIDSELHNTGVSFLRSLIAKHDINLESIELQKVQAGRQRNNIDVWVEVNDEIFIIIEDKTHTKDHSNQLARYKEQAESYLNSQGHGWKVIIPIYLKTGNESLDTLLKKNDAGYHTFDRKDFLDVLSKSQSKNAILIDYRGNLEQFDCLTFSYKSTPVQDNWEWHGIEGYYCELQKSFNQQNDKWSNWQYVPNPAGGFLGFFWHWRPLPKFSCQLYLQMEHGVHSKNLYIRNEAVDHSNLLCPQEKYEILSRLQSKANDLFLNKMRIEKAGRFKQGRTGAIAKISQGSNGTYMSVDSNGNIDMESTVQFLSKVEKLVDAVANSAI